MPAQRFVWLGMNVEHTPLNDIRVRQALRYGVDVNQIVEAGYEGLAKRLNAMLPASVGGYWADAPS